MTHEDLLELASLDALAMLGEQDAALFERTFLAAPPEVQREVREFQASIATDPIFLADDEPSEMLRLRVMAKLTAQIRRSKAELEPVAMVAAGRVIPTRRRAGALLRSAVLWQAASFALFAGLVTSIIFYTKAVDEVELMARDIGTLHISDKVRSSLGGSPWAVMGRAETKIALNSPDRSAAGTVFIDERSSMLVVVAYGLPQTGKPPVLHVVSPSGAEQLALPLRYEGDGVIRAGYAELAGLDVAALAQCTFTVIDGTNKVLLS